MRITKAGVSGDITVDTVNGATVELTANSDTILGSATTGQSLSTGNSVAIGAGALSTATGAASVVAVGTNSGATLGTGDYDVVIGGGADVAAAGSTYATAVGYTSVAGTRALALGKSASATGDGSVAIGTDSGGTGASTSTANEIKLGTANHTVSIPGSATVTGAVTATNAITADRSAGTVNTWISSKSANGYDSGFLLYQGTGGSAIRWAVKDVATTNAFAIHRYASGSDQGAALSLDYSTGDATFEADVAVTGTINGLTLDQTGTRNIAISDDGTALDSLTSGTDNVAVGFSSGTAITSGGRSTFLGAYTGRAFTTVSSNTGVGYGALSDLSASGGSNTAIGDFALGGLTSGNSNVAVGQDAGSKPANNAANETTTGAAQTLVGMRSGQGSATQRNYITCVGHYAQADGDYATALGQATSAGAAGAVAIGTDSGGAGASTSTANEIMLGTANHTVTAPGNVVTAASTTTKAGFRLGDAGTAPTSPVNGDMWIESNTLKIQLGGSTYTVTVS